MQYDMTPSAVAQTSVEERAAFITRTYLHLLGAILAFVGLEFVIFASGLVAPIAEVAMGSRMGWMLFLGGFVAVSYLADKWARSATSIGMQYAGLSLYVVAQSIMFAPLLLVAAYYDVGILPKAALITAVLFGGLTGIVFLTRKDFSFMRGALMLGGFVGMGLLVASLIFGFSLGVVFSWCMLGLAGGYMLYNTSNVMLHYRTDQHVSAALTLFADVTLMLWYVIRILLNSRR
ncbi:MAG: US12 family protein [Polyangiaceae bacterium]|nr:US12 family protein [Polyangiaceae bacterium]